ncbi:MAG: glycosyltransferase [Flavisolibacter sp.]
MQYRTDTFLSERSWSILYKKGSLFQKILAVLTGFIKRFYIVLFIAPEFNFIVVHREAAPIGPPVFEWILARLFRKKLIFDFDDAIWIPNITESNKIASTLKWYSKIKHICSWSYKISAGNQFLAEFAAKFNNHVQIVPTCVNTESRYNRIKDQRSLRTVIGWTGSHSTLHYLDRIVPVLKRLELEYDFDVLIICDKQPQFQLKNLQFIFWNEKTEIDDLLKMNIGIMPLEQDAWSEGKCGFKIIQYLSLGIPAVASPVGVNKQIIDNEMNGYLCETEEQWYHSLSYLLSNEEQRSRLGKAGREKINAFYSIHSNADNFISLFS